MRMTRRPLSMNFKRYLVPVVLLIVIFFATDYVLVRTIRNYYLAILEAQLTSIGQIYSHSLAKVARRTFLSIAFSKKNCWVRVKRLLPS